MIQPTDPLVIEAARQAAEIVKASSPNPWGTPAAMLGALALIVSTLSLLNSWRSRAEASVSSRERLTRERIEDFNSPAFRAKRNWVLNELESHRVAHSVSEYSGFTALNKSGTIKLSVANEKKIEILPGDISHEVLRLIDGIATDVRKNRVDNYEIMKATASDISALWHVLRRMLPRKWSTEYYHYTKKKWSVDRLVRIIDQHPSNTSRVKAVGRRWGTGA